MNFSDQDRKYNGRFVVGLVILITGLLFLFNNFNLLPPKLDYYIFSWKTLLIAIGVLNLVFSHNRTAGFILITVGVVFWIPDIFALSVSAGRFIWPLAIVAVGIFLILNPREGKFSRSFWENKFKGYPNDSESDTELNEGRLSDDYLENVSIFGGGDRIVTSNHFRGGKITAIFGGSNFHMRNAKLAPGKNYLDVFLMFGGAEIIVPSDWIVKVDVVSIFGGFSDKRMDNPVKTLNQDSGPVLYIKGFAIFGGGDVKSY